MRNITAGVSRDDHYLDLYRDWRWALGGPRIEWDEVGYVEWLASRAAAGSNAHA